MMDPMRDCGQNGGADIAGVKNAVHTKMPPPALQALNFATAAKKPQRHVMPVFAAISTPWRLVEVTLGGGVVAIWGVEGEATQVFACRERLMPD
jgi:hypothetical protein